MKTYELEAVVDLDGVLANFAGRIEEITGKKCESVSRGHLWASVQKYNDEVAPFFETLDKMPDADELWEFVTSRFGHVSILTATGYTPKNGADQKIAWVRKHFGSHIPVRVVTSGSLKGLYASPKKILVDDTRKAIDPWVTAGGIGVFHINTADSIKQLEEILTSCKR